MNVAKEPDAERIYQLITGVIWLPAIHRADSMVNILEAG